MSFKWLDKEVKARLKPMSGPMKIRGNTEFRFLLYDVLNVAGDMKIKKRLL